LRRKIYHVTPYLETVLRDGKLLPPSISKNIVLGENLKGGKTIRGCLLSFFDDLQTALSGCYSLALYAILSKQLLSDSEFKDLLRLEMETHGLSEEFGLDPDPEEVFDLITTSYRLGQINVVFIFMRKVFGFQDPRILTDTWTLDLPDTVEGILDAIGIIEIDIDRKFVADPSVFEGGAPSIYDDYGIGSKGDFGQDLYAFYEIFEMDIIDDTEKMGIMSNQGAEIAYEINDLCKVGTSHFEMHERDTLRRLKNRFGSEIEEDLEVNSEGDIRVFDAITFVSEVTVDVNQVAIWNPIENEWRIPAPTGIPVNSKNVVARAGDVEINMGRRRLMVPSDLKGTWSK
jgi:hypothetical protein